MCKGVHAGVCSQMPRQALEQRGIAQGKGGPHPWTGDHGLTDLRGIRYDSKARDLAAGTGCGRNRHQRDRRMLDARRIFDGVDGAAIGQADAQAFGEIHNAAAADGQNKLKTSPAEARGGGVNAHIGGILRNLIKLFPDNAAGMETFGHLLPFAAAEKALSADDKDLLCPKAFVDYLTDACKGTVFKDQIICNSEMHNENPFHYVYVSIYG